MSQGGWEAQATDLTLLYLTDSPLGESKLPVFFRQLNKRAQPFGSVLPISTLQALQLQHVASQGTQQGWAASSAAGTEGLLVTCTEPQRSFGAPWDTHALKAADRHLNCISHLWACHSVTCACYQSTGSLLLSHLISHQEPFSSLRGSSQTASPAWSQNRSASLQLHILVPGH